ncbi:S-layer homology domain-containing protein [Paenibacillus filicis]|uniref:S-layer homology domain-containing protein n=1 Tax=Paenibacillus gyeongsangnamensis TaxID=3388067 RepID=A0ABT4Q6Z1_9BACL|nr:S-layer homology domain-containing protein [Paenibacillus filicis]MCZ8512637.1 S-layer homology domain-containing protein [Paenibacillus filicis]
MNSKAMSKIFSLATAFSMVVSGPVLAAEADATKDSSSFSDLKDLDAATKAKFDELIKGGVFDGVKDNVFGLKDKMNRAQFAKVASLIFQLKVDSFLKASSFSDVKADDPANGYALPYIEAIYKAGITDGYAAGQFNPAGEVTKEQLVAFLLRGLNLDTQAKATPGVSDQTVSDWAKGYVALALQKKLMTSGTDGSFGGTSAATREVLVLAAYEAKKQVVPAKPDTVTKVSIAKAEATGAKTITVTLNGAIADTSKLNVSISRGSSAVTATPKWNDNKNQVTLTLDTKMTEATYSVKLEAVKDGGLTVDKGTADVAVQNEKITKIEFVSSSDTVAQGEKVKIAFKALNQYNEQSDLSASRFNIVTSPDLGAQLSGSEQALSVNIYKAVNSSPALLVRDQLFAVTIIALDNTAQASKTFKVGDRQSIAKVELGDLKLLGGKTQLEAGDSAYLAYKAYDQYGFEVTDLKTLRDGTSTYNTGANALVSGTTTDSNGLQVDKGFDFYDDEDGDDRPELKINTVAVDMSTFLVEQELNLTVVAHQSGQSATKKVKLNAPKIPYEISFGSTNNTIAWGDDDVYLPIVVKDKFGNTLSGDDVLKYAGDISIYAYGSAGAEVGTEGRIEITGANKGKIRIGGLKINEETRKSGSLTINALVTKTGKSATYTTTISEKRYPNQIYVSSEPKPKMLPSLAPFGANASTTEDKMKLKFKDQYGEDFDKDYGGYEVELSFSQVGGNSSVTGNVYFSKGSMNGTPTWSMNADPKSGKPSTLKFIGDDTRADGYSTASTSIKAIRDTDLTFTPIQGDNYEGSYQVTARLFKSGTNRTQVSSTSRTIDVIKPEQAANLTYSLAAMSNGLYATHELDYASVLTENPADALPSTNIQGVSSPASDIDYMINWNAAKVEVTAKDSSGNNVAMPNNLIRGISISNPRAAQAVLKPKSDSIGYDVYGVRGLEAGTTSMLVSFYPSNYTGIRTALLENVQVKKDAPVTASLSAGENGKGKTIWLSVLNGLSISSGDSVVSNRTAKKKTFGDIKLKDAYGYTEYKNYGVYRTADLYGTIFYVSSLKWSDPANPGTLRIDVDKNAGTAVYYYQPGPGGSRIISFTATVTSGGKTQSVDVFVDANN